ncbi:response regulator transcription factor [Sphingomonas sp. LHG3406-1]|uniref:response regulator transcription factor n=1 Tax=Sphingomonas sp. LHG3406-1 TaxID=2804617 RepID=UPI002625447E|nr:helix-turn-helix transcriptional regulator [Sphingomonas sp. LHG3406-1]
MLNLTERQQQCLEGYLARKTAKEIGRELGISHHAVEQHLKATRRKLNVTDTASAARLYLHAGTTVEPYYDPPELHEPGTAEVADQYPERQIADLRDVTSEAMGRAYSLSAGQVLAAIGLCGVALIVAMTLLLAIAQGIDQITA